MYELGLIPRIITIVLSHSKANKKVPYHQKSNKFVHVLV